jgi:HK97 gp10 family phage protein
MPLKSNLMQFATEAPQVIDAGVEETAKQVEATARGLVPIDTGALRTSIETFGARGIGERTVEAGQSLDYAAHVEYGTVKAPAQPFLTPAAEQHRADLPKNVAAHLKALEGKCRV